MIGRWVFLVVVVLFLSNTVQAVTFVKGEELIIKVVVLQRENSCLS